MPLFPESTRTQLRLVRAALPLLRYQPTAKRSVADLIEKQARRHAQRTFVRFEGRELSYREYNEAANRVAHFAVGRGLGPGDTVALLMDNRPEFLVTWAGFAKAGVTTALINTNLRGKALDHVLEAGSVRALVVGEECLEAIESLSPGLRDGLAIHRVADPGRAEPAAPMAGVEALDPVLAQHSTLNPPRAVREGLCAGDPLFFIYTSGTTGLPKAARFSHSRFMGGGTQHLAKGFSKDDTAYCALPLYHTVGGILAVDAVLATGATLALARKFSASRFFREAAEMQATTFVYIGEFCRYLLNQPPSEHDRAHRIWLALGNGLRPDIWEEFQQRFGIREIAEFYGATESVVALMNLDSRVGSVGKLPAGVGKAKLLRWDVEGEDYVRGEDGKPLECAPGEVGELVGAISKGKTAAGRYEGYTSKEASEKKVLRDLFAEGDAWFRTGDLLRRDEEGYFYFVDRIGDTFRWKGENVSTQEVAEAASAFDGVEICNVYGVQVPNADGRAGMAALSLSPGMDFDPEAFHRHVEAGLPAYARPLFVRIQPELEVTGTFKLRKVDLQREGFDPRVVKDPLYLRDDRDGRYVPLTAELFLEIEDGRRRL